MICIKLPKCLCIFESVQDLHGADLHRADLSGADLHGADLSGAIIDDDGKKVYIV